MLRYVFVILIIFVVGIGFMEVMETWNKHIDLKHKQWEESHRSTIGLPQGVAVEVGGIKLNTTEATITLFTHIKLGGTYYYTELVFPAKEEQHDGTD